MLTHLPFSSEISELTRGLTKCSEGTSIRERFSLKTNKEISLQVPTLSPVLFICEGSLSWAALCQQRGIWPSVMFFLWAEIKGFSPPKCRTKVITDGMFLILSSSRLRSQYQCKENFVHLLLISFFFIFMEAKIVIFLEIVNFLISYKRNEILYLGKSSCF